ncbi:MAG: SGNH/GDSL hydrolase family protein [Maioricimonas sp. JB049]
MSNSHVPLPTANDRWRIVAIGDCNTSGTGRPSEENCVPSRLAQLLGDAGMPCTVQNLGYRMSTTREGLVRTQRDAKPADFVLINFGLVDAWITSIPRIYVPYYPDNVVRKQARKLLKWTKRRLRSPLARRFVPIGTVVPQDEYVQNLRRIVEIVRVWPTEPTVLLWGTALTVGNPERSASIRQYNAGMQELAGDLGVPYIDTPALMEEIDVADAYQDRTHLDAPAIERVAQAMASVVLQRRGRERRAA